MLKETVYDILQNNRELLARMVRLGVSSADIRHLELYDEFVQLKAEGFKAIYIVARLSGKYAVSERSIWRIIRKFQQKT